MFERDCTFYFCDGNFFEVINTIEPKYYQEIKSNKLNEEINQHTFSWIDPIRVSNKIVSREQYNVVIYSFIDKNLVCIFGSSESSICYAIEKLSEYTGIKFRRTNLFEYWLRKYRSDDYWFAEIVNLQVYHSIKGLEYNAEKRKIPITKLSRDEILDYIDSNHLCSISFKTKRRSLCFNLDSGSVVSFFDTQPIEEVNDLVRIISENI
ncbi:MAG: hypothetical protein ACXVNF_06740 [Neobacillus sp.]